MRRFGKTTGTPPNARRCAPCRSTNTHCPLGQHRSAHRPRSAARAELLLTLASGPALPWALIQVHGLKRYPAEAVTRLAGFTQGTPYHQRWLLDYQAALQATPYFQLVRVEAELNPEQPWLSPVHVYVQEAPKKISVGAGYGSDSARAALWAINTTMWPAWACYSPAPCNWNATSKPWTPA